MGVRMLAPEGCDGLNMADGTRYSTDRRTGQVQVEDRHVEDVRTHYGAIGLIDTRNPTTLGTKTTAWCVSCSPSRAWQAWTTRCPRCGAETTTSNGD